MFEPIDYEMHTTHMHVIDGRGLTSAASEGSIHARLPSLVTLLHLAAWVLVYFTLTGLDARMRIMIENIASTVVAAAAPIFTLNPIRA